MQRVAAVVLADRRDPLGLIGSQILLGHAAAILAMEGRQCLRNFAPVERLTTGFTDGTQRTRRRRKLKQFAYLRRAAAGQEGLGKARLGTQFVNGCHPLLLNDGRHEVAALGNFDGWRHKIGEWQLAKALAECRPATDGAGHGNSVEAALGRVVVACSVFAAKVVRRPRLGGTARRIEAMQLVAIPHNAKRVASQAIADRLQNGHGRRGGHRGINRVTAALQHFEPRLCRLRMGRGNNVARKDRGSG